MLLCLPSGERTWIEVAYLHPRFDDEERRSRAVSAWVHKKATSIGFAGSVRCDFFGDDQNPAGPVRRLPLLNQARVFFREPEVRAFFEALRAPPSSELTVTLSRWTVRLTASLQPSRFLHSGGLVQEVPRTVEEHAVYRTLLRKRRQHSVECPRIICIGSDTSRAVSPSSSSWSVRLEHAMSAALSPRGDVSAVYLVQVEDARAGLWSEYQRVARATIYPANRAAWPLTAKDLDALKTIDFNRWRYAPSLNRWTDAIQPNMIRTTNKLTISSGVGTVKLQIPGSQLVAVLAGKEDFIKSYTAPGDPPDPQLTSLLSRPWRIADCRLIPGNVRQGLSELVEISLEPSHEVVYRRESKPNKDEHTTD